MIAIFVIYDPQVLNILASYGGLDAVKGPLGLHRLVEALKHMLAIRMDLGDPNFENISKTVSDMLSPSFAKIIKERIFDNTTFPPEYYMHRSSFCSVPTNFDHLLLQIKLILNVYSVAGGVSLWITEQVIFAL